MKKVFNIEVDLHTCLSPWYIQSQKRRSAQRNVAWNTVSTSVGTHDSTRKVIGNTGSVWGVGESEREG